MCERAGEEESGRAGDKGGEHAGDEGGEDQRHGNELEQIHENVAKGNDPIRCEPGPLELRGGNAVDQSEDHPKDDLPVEFPVPFHA